MDLTIADVAALLNVSEAVIKRWVNEGRLPAYRIGNEWRFSRMEVEDSIMTNKLSGQSNSSATPPSPSTGGSLQFSLYRALHKGMVLTNIEAENKEELIHNCVEAMAQELRVDNTVLTELLLSREKLHSTAVGHGIAIPHTRDFLLNAHQDSVVVAFPAHPIPYDALDNLPVETLFFLFACSDKRHLHLLAKLAHLSNNEQARNLFKLKPSKEELLLFIREWESNLYSAKLVAH